MSEAKASGPPSGPPRPSRPRRSSAGERVDRFLRELRPDVREPALPFVRELVSSAARLLDDAVPIADVRLLNTVVRELVHAFRVFGRYRHVRKITTFGSARLPENDPVCRQAEEFSRRIADEGFMVITGGGDGVMCACQKGAGRERSFGINIRLPFEQRPNEFIAEDAKLVTLKYFFTRKLLFVKEADAIVLFPGGFGTLDEGFEALTLVQTGKTVPVPIVFLDAPGGAYWKAWHQHAEDLVRIGMVSAEDLSLFRVTDDVERAVNEIRSFYRVFHSTRYVGDRLVIRLQHAISDAVVKRLHDEFSDLLASGGFQIAGALPEEHQDETAALPRLVLHFNRANFGRLRQMIDVLNSADG